MRCSTEPYELLLPTRSEFQNLEVHGRLFKQYSVDLIWIVFVRRYLDNGNELAFIDYRLTCSNRPLRIVVIELS